MRVCTSKTARACMAYTHVHGVHTCTWRTHMYMAYTDVHGIHSCTWRTQMYMAYTHVHGVHRCTVHDVHTCRWRTHMYICTWRTHLKLSVVDENCQNQTCVSSMLVPALWMGEDLRKKQGDIHNNVHVPYSICAD